MRQMNDIPINPMPRPRHPRSTRASVDEEFADELAAVSTAKLRRSDRIQTWVTRASCLATPVCVLAGVWVDWRWLPTALVALVVLAVSAKVHKGVTLELRRRDDAERDEAVELLRDCLPADESDNGPVEVPADALRTLIREGRE